MPFDVIENKGWKPVSEPVPNEGLRVTSRRLNTKGKAGSAGRYIMILIGASLARRMAFHKEAHGVQILFGTGRDQGKLQIALDAKDGQFTAKRRKTGGVYSLPVNGASVAGRFAVRFPEFAIANIETVKSEASGQVCCTFNASPEMLNASGDLA